MFVNFDSTDFTIIENILNYFLSISSEYYWNFRLDDFE